MKLQMQTLLVLSVFLAAVFSLSSASTADEFRRPSLSYSVSGRIVTVVSAVTPYDSNPPAREGFLHWFKRGFETIVTGKSPLLIEWANTPEAEAGRKGYDFGMDEAERYMRKERGAQPSLQTTVMPPSL
jgi:hypothetical protein